MKNFFNNFLVGNEWYFRLARTIVQGIIGVLIANADAIVDALTIAPEWKGIVVALTMAVLSPVMAAIGKTETVN